MVLVKRRLYQLTVIIISLFVIQGLSRNLVELWQQKQRLKRAREQLIRLEQQEVQLKQQLEYYRSDEYVEKIAREKLLLGKEGETVILLPEQQNDRMTNDQLPMTNDGDRGESLPNWRKWLKLFGFYKEF